MIKIAVFIIECNYFKKIKTIKKLFKLRILTEIKVIFFYQGSDVCGANPDALVIGQCVFQN